MPDKTPFVINDRRKFTSEGELRPDAPHREHEEAKPEAGTSTAEAKAPAQPIPFPSSEAQLELQPAEADAASALPGEDHLPPPPTVEQTEQATRAYDATVDRLDTAIRATNPGMERLPEMSYERLVQSLYMQALLQLGAAAEPGQTPQVDLLGGRQTIDMLTVVAEKSRGNLTDNEDRLTQSALFELRMAFLEITQALARQTTRPPGAPGAPTGPSIVR